MSIEGIEAPKTLQWRRWFGSLSPERQEALRQERRDAMKARRAGFSDAERARINDRTRELYASDLERNRELARLQQQRHRERHPEAGSSPAAKAAYNAAWRFGESVPTDEWEAIWSGSCFGCGVTPAEGVDHIIPFSRGGRNVIENLQPSCLACNRRKAAKI